MKKAIIITSVIIVISIASYFGYVYFTKKSLVAKIMYKYKDPSSPDYVAMYKVTNAFLMNQDIKTLRGILDRSITDVHL